MIIWNKPTKTGFGQEVHRGTSGEFALGLSGNCERWNFQINSGDITAIQGVDINEAKRQAAIMVQEKMPQLKDDRRRKLANSRDEKLIREFDALAAKRDRAKTSKKAAATKMRNREIAKFKAAANLI